MNDIRCPVCNHFVSPTRHRAFWSCPEGHLYEVAYQLTPATVWQRLAYEIRTDGFPRGAWRLPSQRHITVTDVYDRIKSGLSDIDRRIFARVIKKIDQPTRLRILTSCEHVWFDTRVVDPGELPQGESVQAVTVEYRLLIGPSPGYVQVIDTSIQNVAYQVKSINLPA